MTTYLAIFKQADGNEYLIEYRPCYDEMAGGIEVMSVTHTKRNVNWQEQRAENMRVPIERKPRQMELFDKK